MTEPSLSVAIASLNGFPYIGDCLEALARNAPEAEVIVADATDSRTRSRIREGWPHVRVLEREPSSTIPELRAAAIGAARGSSVAVIEDHCLVRSGWADILVRWHQEGKHVVGGPVHNAVAERIRDRASFYCEYSEFLEPMTLGAVPGLAGMNVSYDRVALEAVGDLLAQGRWETWLHARLVEHGHELWCDPALVIDHDKDFGIREFLTQRYHYSRAYAGMRSPELGARRVVYALGAPLLPPVLFARIVRNVRRAGGHGRAFLPTVPLVLVDLLVWAYGEMVGYALGAGGSLEKVR